MLSSIHRALPAIEKMKYPEFNIRGFNVPKFEIESGKMVRFWVQIVPDKENDQNGYWGVKRIFEIIDNYNNKNYSTKIHLCKNQVSLRLFDFIKPISTKDYLKNLFGQKSTEIISILETFNIKEDYTLRKMGLAHKKILSIICGIESNEVIAFDFYGFAPETEEKLMDYVKIKLKEGKAVIGFDNLGYKEEQLENTQIDNQIIKRI